MSERDDATHLSPDTLADLQEGLLDADGEAAARRHLEACGDCRADLAALTDLPGRLAAAGDVGPVPELVAARLGRVLADAASEIPATPPPAARTVTPRAPDRGPVRGMRLLQAAAAVVLVLGVGALGISALTGEGGNQDTAGTAGGAADSAGGDAGQERAAVAPVTASGRDWTAASLRTDAAGLVDGGLGRAYALYDRSAAPDTNAGGGSAEAPTASPPAAQKDLARAAGGADRLADPSALRACVSNLTDGDPTLQPVAVDLARWQGRPAGVLVFPTADDPASLDVFVVAPDCPTGLFLHFERVPRS